MRRFLPKSLLGQMLLAVALALLVAQTISAVLQYRAAEQRRAVYAASGLAFQLVSEPSFEFRSHDSHKHHGTDRGRWQRLRVERTDTAPLHPGEPRETEREELLRSILADQGVDPAQLVVINRRVGDDNYVMSQLQETSAPSGPTGGCSSRACSAAARANGRWRAGRSPGANRASSAG